MTAEREALERAFRDAAIGWESMGYFDWESADEVVIDARLNLPKLIEGLRAIFAREEEKT